MKITYIDLYKFFVYLILFVNLGFLNVNNNMINYFLARTGMLSLILFIIYLTQKNKAKVDFKIENIFTMFIFGYLIFQLFRILNGTVTGIDITRAFRSNLMYLLLLLIFPMKEIIYYDGYHTFLKNIFKLGFLASLLKFLVYILYNYFNIIFMNGIIDERGLGWVRNGSLRLTATFLDGFVFCYAIYMFFKNDKKIYILPIIYEFIYAIFVYQSRSQTICFVITFVVMFLFNRLDITKNLFNIILVGMGVFLIIKSSLFNELLKSFSIMDTQNGAGTQVRIDGLNFYLQQWLHFNIPFGLGLTFDGTSISTMYLGTQTAFLSDLGIIGTLFRLGIVGFIIWIFPMIYGLIRSILNIFKNSIAFLSMGLTTYIILSSLMSQNVYNSVRIAILPIWIIVIFLAGYSKGKIIDE